MNKISYLIVILTALFIIVSFSLWFTYEKPYPDWWNKVKPGDTYAMWESEFDDDAIKGYDWGGKWNKIGGYYIKRSEWIRTEYFAQATIENNTISKWKIIKFQYSVFGMFKKIYRISIESIINSAFSVRKYIFYY